jgi:IgGFc binding protein
MVSCRRLVCVVALVASAASMWACAPEHEFGAPPIAGYPTTGSDSGGGAGSGPFDPPPDPCVEAADSGDSGSGGEPGEGEPGFKFDVGAPGGPIGFSLTCDDVAAVPSNLGCTFWAVDLPNDERGTPMSPPAADQPFAVVIANVSALGDAHVEIRMGDDDGDPLAEATIAPTATQTFELGTANIPAMMSSRDGLAFRIDSDVPVAAYQFNPSGNTVEVYSNDASLLLPENALAEDYTAATADGILLGTSGTDPNPVNAGAFVSIVATTDDTHIQIDATAALVGEAFDEVVLDRGEVATVLSDALGEHAGNLSGTRVHADAPIAVFAGNVATAIPASSDVCCADHLEHQLLPDTAWGTRYAIAPPPAPSGGGDAPARYSIIAGAQDTELVWCPKRPDGAPVQLDAGEHVAFDSDAPFTVRSTESDAPFSMTQFTLSNTELGDDDLGDPAMIVIPPTGQHELRSVFVVPEGYIASWATVVVRDAVGLRVDGEPVDQADLQELGTLDGVPHFYLHVLLPAGTHSLESESPAGVTVIGVDEAVGYGFAGGSGVRVLSIPPAAG